jgi:hypothetical protein
MEVNPFNWSLTFIGGTFTIVIAIAFTIAALFLYNGTFVLTDHFIGDLGNPALNPVGYIMFNCGLILVGISLMVFMMGMIKWRTKGIDDRRLSFAIVSGVAAGVGFVVNGNYSESYAFLNVFWYAVSIVMLLVSILIFNFELQNHPKFIKPIAYYGYMINFMMIVLILLTLLSIFTTALVSVTNMMLWLSYGMVLIWIALIEINTVQLPAPTQQKP